MQGAMPLASRVRLAATTSILGGTMRLEMAEFPVAEITLGSEFCYGSGIPGTQY